MCSMPDRGFVPSFVAGLPLARDALAFAAELHHGQQRSSDEAPFILHPLEVAALLHMTGHSETAVAAGILHDTVEDTPVEISTIEQRFGGTVAALVAAMTEDPEIAAYHERKAALRRQIAAFGDSATAIYAADKVAKVRELRAQAGRDPGLLVTGREDVLRRLEHYVESLAMLEVESARHPLVQQLRFELEALQALPPHAPSVS